MSWKLLQETEFTGTLRWIKSYDSTIQNVDFPKFFRLPEDFHDAKPIWAGHFFKHWKRHCFGGVRELKTYENKVSKTSAEIYKDN